jgi:uncharacterized protein (DUF302 family)
MTTTHNGLSLKLHLSCEEARALVTEALSAEGFGVLTEIDVKDTLAKKLGVDVPPYTILGACNPKLAHAALSADPDIGLLLPCNVVLRADGDGCIVSVMDPLLMAGYSDSETVREIAHDARERIDRVIAAVAARTAA